MPEYESASRVRELLASHGMTQRDLADAIELDADKVSKSLSGVRRFTSLELANIADRFAVTVNWLLGIDEPPVAVAARYSGSHVRTDPTLERIGDFAEVRSSLVELGYSNEVPQFDPGDSPIWIEQGERVAEQALDLLDKHEAGLRPSEMIESIERVFNVDVVLIDLEVGCDGLAWRSGQVGLIAAATTSSSARQRFTLAHELCHALIGDDQQLHIDNNVTQTNRQPSEIRANVFAACLLMPERRLRFDSRTNDVTNDAFASMVMDYAVSPGTLAWRLLNLGIIDEAQRRHLDRFTTAECASRTNRSGDLAEWVTASARPRPPLRLLRDSLGAYLENKATLRLFSRVADVPSDAVRDAIEIAASEPGGNAV